MTNYKIWVLIIILSLTALISSTYAIDDAELRRAMDKVQGENGAMDADERKKAEAYLRITLEMPEKIAFDKIQGPCAAELKKLCGKRNIVSDTVKCIKENREQVSPACEDALRNEFGDKPLKEAQLHNGVMVPKGSIFHYVNGKIIGATIPEKLTYNGIEFKAGEIRFFDDKPGIWVAPLTKDQVIHGIKFKSGNAIGPFFNERGDVVNATLAEDTTIGNVTYQGGAQIQFYSNSRVQFGILAKDAVIQGKKYETGGIIWYETDGTVSRYTEKPSDGKLP